jgi:uncharacterized membrane protein YgcG
MRKLCVLITAILLAILFCIPSFALAPTVVDRAQLLNSTERQQLEQGISGAEDSVSYYLLTFVAMATAPDDTTVVRACGIGADEDAVVLVIRKVGSAYYYDMYTFNRADEIFSRSDVNRVLDSPEVYGNIKEGRPGAGAHAFFGECAQVVRDYEQAQANKQRLRPLIASLWGLGIGVVAGGIAVLCVFLYYRKKQHGEAYPLHRYTKMNLTVCNDVFVGTSVTRVRVQSSSSGGRSGGGGGFSGGHRCGR